MEVQTIFRKYKDGSIIAVFPYQFESETEISAYHNGNELAVNYDVIRKDTVPAFPKEFKKVREILESPPYGMTVIVTDRVNVPMLKRKLSEYLAEKNLQIQ